MSWQHVKSYQDGYRLVTLCTHGDFICWHTAKSGCQYQVQISYSVALSSYWANQSLPYPINTECLTRKRKISMIYISQWFDLTRNWTPISRTQGSRSTNSVIVPDNEDNESIFYMMVTMSPSYMVSHSYTEQWLVSNLSSHLVFIYNSFSVWLFVTFIDSAGGITQI